MSEPCCVGVPSGYVTPDGIEARMCDDACRCSECVEQRGLADVRRDAHGIEVPGWWLDEGQEPTTAERSDFDG